MSVVSLALRTVLLVGDYLSSCLRKFGGEVSDLRDLKCATSVKKRACESKLFHRKTKQVNVKSAALVVSLASVVSDLFFVSDACAELPSDAADSPSISDVLFL